MNPPSPLFRFIHHRHPTSAVAALAFRKVRTVLFACLLIFLLTEGSAPATAQPFATGSVADNFTLKNYRTGEDVSLSDFEGKIVVLDFFAYWCAPCAFSSPDIEENIQRLYAQQGGNPNGVEVQVLAVNIESESPDLTDSFIEDVGMDLVVDDPDAVAWNRFNETNGIPLFVVINGVRNSPSHQQWEVLHNGASYPGSEFLRNLIDTVEPAAEEPDLIANAVDIGGDWRWVPWFGRFQTTDSNWIYHEDFAWLSPGAGNLEEGQFFFAPELGWIWTGRSVYPRYFVFENSDWERVVPSSIGSDPGGTLDPGVVPVAEDEPEIIDNSALNFDFANGFDLTFTTVLMREIITGGPPRDGIPAIHEPRFVSVGQADYLEGNDIVVAVTSGHVTRAYPFRIMNWHEVVNDQIGNDAFVVTYCPLCGTAMVFDAEVEGEKRSFGVSGLLYQNNLLMYDLETESLWSQFGLRAVSGESINSRLTWRRSEQMTWVDFQIKYPAGQVLSDDTGFNRDYDLNPYALYFDSPGVIFPTGERIRDDLPAKEWVWGLTVGDVAKAYPLGLLTDRQSIRDTVNGVQLELTLNDRARSVSVINVATGEPHENGVGAFWFSWQDFYPDTEVYF